MGELLANKILEVNENDYEAAVEVITEAMLEKKANNPVCLDLTGLSKSIFDKFIIASADSTPQVKAIADNVEDKAYEKLNMRVSKRQGDDNGIWIILDFGHLVVHVFRTDYRDYYRLEDLWADAEITKYE